jgi:epoxyqueuosine reductase
VGVAGPGPFTETRQILEARKAEGLHGGMQFTYRNPGRSTEPARALPEVRAIVVGARAYPAARPPVPDDGEPYGRVARYSAHDRYGELRMGLEAIADVLRRDGWTVRVVLDDNALVDRAAAHRAGLGWYGKNSNILLPGEGSWFVLGSVLTDAPLPCNEVETGDGCGSCRRCIDACPTGAIVAPGVVDARRCLAWLVQAEGDFPEDLREALGDRIYGCDDCQEVCPPNRASARSATETPGADRRDGTTDGTWVALLDLLEAGDDELLARHGRWYVPRRDPAYLRRNALVALGNCGTPEGHASSARITATVQRYLASPDDMLRRHAAWAARRLGIDAESQTPTVER